MQGAIMLFAVFHRAKESFVGEKISIFNGLCNARQFLINHPPCADVQVANLGIAHLAGRKADRVSGCFNLRMRVCIPKLPDMLYTVRTDRVSIDVLPAAKAVENN